MVIMHVVAPATFGGLERVVQMLGMGLRGMGHEVHIVSVVAEPGAGEPFLFPLSDAGVNTHQIVVSARGYGGNSADVTAWDPSGARLAPPLTTAVGPGFLRRLRALEARAPVSLTLTLNLASRTAAQATRPSPGRSVTASRAPVYPGRAFIHCPTRGAGSRQRSTATPRAARLRFHERTLLSVGSAGSARRRGPMCCWRL